jgi:iron complex transport system permease protein
MRPKPIIVLMLLLLILSASLLLAASLGTAPVPFDDILAVAVRHIFGISIGIPYSEMQEAIVWQIRLPRVVAAAIVGAALATAGVLFQGLLRNPMADPYLLGTSSGAALAATIALFMPTAIMPFGFALVPIAAFGGALGAVMLVYNLARVGPRAPITTLLLAGFAVSAMMSAMISFLMLTNQNTLHRVVLWMMGGISTNGWDALKIVVPLIFLGALAALALSSDLNALLLGEDQAASLGVAVERAKIVLIILGALLTGAAVAISGLVGFVGLIVPHVVRLILGPDHRLLLPASFLSGAIFVVLADLLARLVLAPAELPLGVVTAFIGAPFFIYLLRHTKHDYTF